jgi:hypothetical protein
MTIWTVSSTSKSPGPIGPGLTGRVVARLAHAPPTRPRRPGPVGIAKGAAHEARLAGQIP